MVSPYRSPITSRSSTPSWSRSPSDSEAWLYALPSVNGVCSTRPVCGWTVRRITAAWPVPSSPGTSRAPSDATARPRSRIASWCSQVSHRTGGDGGGACSDSASCGAQAARRSGRVRWVMAGLRWVWEVLRRWGALADGVFVRGGSRPPRARAAREDQRFSATRSSASNVSVATVRPTVSLRVCQSPLVSGAPSSTT
jgi:hypothetical protein